MVNPRDIAGERKKKKKKNVHNKEKKQFTNHSVDLVVKASASKAEGSIPACTMKSFIPVT